MATSDRPSNKYLRFAEHPPAVGRKTAVVEIFSNSQGALLGSIRWHGPWRQYTFCPQGGTIFNKGCMATIVDYIDALMAERWQPA